MAESSYLWQETLCRENRAPFCTFIIFGASGDLAFRKLFPSLYTLHRKGLLHPESRIIACARHPYDTESFREKIFSLLSRNLSGQEAVLHPFLEKITYCILDYSRAEDFIALGKRLPDTGLRIFYLALPSSLYTETIRNLSRNALLAEDPDKRRKCLAVFEKPFGLDLDSFHALDKALKVFLREDQIYRIDHYLGKETVQNIFLLRFANRIFEPVWNRDYIDSIQITVSETLGVENRAGYFDKTGILCDMFQNHLLEMLSLVTMECPRQFTADAVRDEKVKLIRSIRPPEPEDAVRAQYESYRSEKGIDRNSRTETFACMRLFIDSWRWQAVPIYLRAGKKLAEQATEIHILFKTVPYSIFPGIDKEDLTRNVLHLSIQKQEAMALTLHAKKPGPKLCMGSLTLCYDHSAGETEYPDAYARLLLDCQQEDQTLFVRSDVIESSWELFQGLLNSWKKESPHAIPLYKDGSDGPEESAALLRADGRKWILLH